VQEYPNFFVRKPIAITTVPEPDIFK